MIFSFPDIQSDKRAIIIFLETYVRTVVVQKVVLKIELIEI